MKTNNKTMKRFFISSTHEVFVDDYNEGELNNVNDYNLNSFINAEDPRQAIEKYFDTVLGYDFSFELSDFEDGYLNYSVLVDEDDLQATETEKVFWRNGKKTLYCNNIRLKVGELIKINEL